MATAGRPSTRVIEVASLKVGLMVATSPSVTEAAFDAATGIWRTSCGCLDQGRDLDGEPALRTLQGAGCHQAVALRRDLGELVERNPEALQEHRLGDDLDGFVARPLEVGRQHARHLLDGVLGVARDLSERPFRNIARQRHHQDRQEAEIDLVHPGLVGVGGEVALGVVDLGADVLQRHGRN